MQEKIQRICADQGELLRKIYLRALEADPHSFGPRHVAASARPMKYWTERSIREAASNDTAIFFLHRDSLHVGMAGAYFEHGNRAAAILCDVWVEEAFRSQGAGTRLVNVACGWLKTQGATRVDTWITKANTHILKIYETLGFTISPSQRAMLDNPMVDQVKLSFDTALL